MDDDDDDDDIHGEGKFLKKKIEKRPVHCVIYFCRSLLYNIIIIYPLTARAVGVPQMISQPVFGMVTSFHHMERHGQGTT